MGVGGAGASGIDRPQETCIETTYDERNPEAPLVTLPSPFSNSDLPPTFEGPDLLSNVDEAGATARWKKVA
jgi:hypothetical protein